MRMTVGVVLPAADDRTGWTDRLKKFPGSGCPAAMMPRLEDIRREPYVRLQHIPFRILAGIACKKELVFAVLDHQGDRGIVRIVIFAVWRQYRYLSCSQRILRPNLWRRVFQPLVVKRLYEF